MSEQTAAKLRAARTEIRSLRNRIALLERELPMCVPTTWLDSLLTGESAVIGPPPWNCPEVERLLNAIRARMADVVSR